MEEIGETNLLVAAIDFGTAFSGYAFSFKDKPTDVKANPAWNAGSQQLLSLKTSTSVLVDADGQFDSFGFEAENKYADLAIDGNHRNWRFFQKFKMSLHDNPSLSKQTTIEDVTGQQHEALPIFAMSIRYLRDQLLRTLNNMSIGIADEDINYVITVPAMWNEEAKRFMRGAAEQAGIVGQRLKIALEPEAASIWCIHSNSGERHALSEDGAKYMVVDLGGGTADISVHEKVKDGKVKEIHKASGGPWGGTYVDQNYMHALEGIFGEDILAKLKEEDMVDYLDLFRDFELKKRTFSVESQSKIVIKIASMLIDLFREKSGKSIQDALSNNSDVSLHGRDKLRFSIDSVKMWFDGPVNAIIGHIKGLFAEDAMKDVKYILLVGGFAESRYVQERIRGEFPEKHLIVPDGAGLAVLKGAVVFGHFPGIITSRIMKYSYGTAVYKEFKAGKHDPSWKRMSKGKEKVAKCFSVFVAAGDEIRVDQIITKRQKPNKQRSSIAIFYSPDPNPEFVTDPMCHQIGVLEVTHSKDRPLDEQQTNVTFVFGDTELEIKAESSGTGIMSSLRFSSFEDETTGGACRTSVSQKEDLY